MASKRKKGEKLVVVSIIGITGILALLFLGNLQATITPTTAYHCNDQLDPDCGYVLSGTVSNLQPPALYWFPQENFDFTVEQGTVTGGSIPVKLTFTGIVHYPTNQENLNQPSSKIYVKGFYGTVNGPSSTTLHKGPNDQYYYQVLSLNELPSFNAVIDWTSDWSCTGNTKLSVSETKNCTLTKTLQVPIKSTYWTTNNTAAARCAASYYNCPTGVNPYMEVKAEQGIVPYQVFLTLDGARIISGYYKINLNATLETGVITPPAQPPTEEIILQPVNEVNITPSTPSNPDLPSIPPAQQVDLSGGQTLPSPSSNTGFAPDSNTGRLPSQKGVTASGVLGAKVPLFIWVILAGVGGSIIAGIIVARRR